jgi:DHA2 family multidrug resistance protein-like MFS transporter
MSPAAPTTRRAGRRKWLALAVLALPCIVYAMDLTVLHLAVPSISADLGPSGTELLWIVDIYGFVTAGLLVTMGTLGDRIGRRRLLLIGSATFAAASVAAAFATSVEMLIAARALLGAAGATLAPSTLSLIRELFEDQRQRTTAVGVWIASFSTGAAIGPLVGGVLLEHFDWGSVFLAALPVMALVLAVGPRLLPEYRAPDAGRIDARSVVLSIAAVLPVVYGLKHLARDGWDLTGPLTFAAGIVLALAFVRRQRRLDDPLLDLRLFGSPGFNAALAANGLGFFVNFGFALFVAQYLQAVLGLSTLTAGLWSLPAAVAFIVGSMVTPKVAAQVSAPNVVAGGLGVAAGGFALLTQVGVDVGLASAVAGSVLSAIGLSAVFTLAADLIVGSAPPQRAAAQRRSPRRVPSSAAPSASRSSVRSARPCTAALCRPARRTPSARRFWSAATLPTLHARRSCKACRSRPASARRLCSRPPQGSSPLTAGEPRSNRHSTQPRPQERRHDRHRERERHDHRLQRAGKRSPDDPAARRPRLGRDMATSGDAAG